MPVKRFERVPKAGGGGVDCWIVGRQLHLAGGVVQVAAG
jgi:hypothetical protein